MFIVLAITETCLRLANASSFLFQRIFLHFGSYSATTTKSRAFIFFDCFDNDDDNEEEKKVIHNLSYDLNLSYE